MKCEVEQEAYIHLVDKLGEIIWIVIGPSKVQKFKKK